jgi:hypothetical protein
MLRRSFLAGIAGLSSAIGLSADEGSAQETSEVLPPLACRIFVSEPAVDYNGRLRLSIVLECLRESGCAIFVPFWWGRWAL